MAHIERAAVVELWENAGAKSVPLFIKMIYDEPGNATIRCRNICDPDYLVKRSGEEYVRESKEGVHQDLYMFNYSRMINLVQQYKEEQERNGSEVRGLNGNLIHSKEVAFLIKVKDGLQQAKSKHSEEGSDKEAEAQLKLWKEVKGHIKAVMRNYLLP